MWSDQVMAYLDQGLDAVNLPQMTVLLQMAISCIIKLSGDTNKDAFSTAKVGTYFPILHSEIRIVLPYFVQLQLDVYSIRDN